LFSNVGSTERWRMVWKANKSCKKTHVLARQLTSRNGRQKDLLGSFANSSLKRRGESVFHSFLSVLS